MKGVNKLVSRCVYINILKATNDEATLEKYVSQVNYLFLQNRNSKILRYWCTVVPALATPALSMSRCISTLNYLRSADTCLTIPSLDQRMEVLRWLDRVDRLVPLPLRSAWSASFWRYDQGSGVKIKLWLSTNSSSVQKIICLL